MLSWVKLVAVVALLALPSADAKDLAVAKKSKHCKRDHLVCDDGSKVYRNKELDCDFDVCPEDEEEEEEEEPNEPDEELDDDDLDDANDDDDDDEDLDDEDEASEAIVVFATTSPAPSTLPVPHADVASNGTDHVTSHSNATFSPAKNNSSTGTANDSGAHQGPVNTTSTASNSSAANNTIVAPTSVLPAAATTTHSPSRPSTKPTKAPKHPKQQPTTHTLPSTSLPSTTHSAPSSHATQEPQATRSPQHTPSHRPSTATPVTTQHALARGWEVVPAAPSHVWAAMTDAFAHYQNNDAVCTLFKVEPSYVEHWNGTYHVIAHADCRLRDMVALAGKFSLVLEPAPDTPPTDKQSTALQLTACGWEDRWGVVINWLTVDLDTGAGLCETPHEKAHFDAQPLQYVKPPANASMSSSLSEMAHGVVHGIVQDKTKVAGVAIAAGAISALVVVAMGALMCRKRRRAPPAEADDEDTVLEKVPLSSKSPPPQGELEEGKFH